MIFFTKKENIEDFVKLAVEKLKKKYPVSMDTAEQRRISERKLTKLLETTFENAQIFRDKNKLGLLGKAKLVNEFKWFLKDNGYSEAFVDLAGEGMTVYLSRKD